MRCEASTQQHQDEQTKTSKQEYIKHTFSHTHIQTYIHIMQIRTRTNPTYLHRNARNGISHLLPPPQAAIAVPFLAPRWAARHANPVPPGLLTHMNDPDPEKRESCLWGIATLPKGRGDKRVTKSQNHHPQSIDRNVLCRK